MGEGARKRKQREKKNIGNWGGVKDQRIIVFLYIMFYSNGYQGRRRYAIAKDKDNFILAR